MIKITKIERADYSVMYHFSDGTIEEYNPRHLFRGNVDMVERLEIISKLAHFKCFLKNYFHDYSIKNKEQFIWKSSRNKTRKELN